MKRSWLRFSCAAVAVIAQVVLVAPAFAVGPLPMSARNRCFDSKESTAELNLRVEDERATGRYALPPETPKALVVYAHGYGHTSDSWVEHMEVTAAEHGAIAVAMDYRGLVILKGDEDKDGLRDSTGWPVMAGAEDSIAAAQHFLAMCPSIEKSVIFGVSMGGNSSGLAVALSKDAKRSDDTPLFDYWVDVEGAVNVIETYQGARALAPFNAFAAQAQADIEEEMGGSFESAPGSYRDHCVVCRVGDIAASGVKGVVVVHGVDDGLVPYNQGREMTQALMAEGVPVHMTTVGAKDGADGKDTSATGYVGGQLDEDYNSPFAGHASETSSTHPVMRHAFEALWDLLKGGEIGPYGEAVVNEG